MRGPSRLRRFFFGSVITSFAAAAITLGACVGDDPAAVTPAPAEGGGDEASPPERDGGSTTDALPDTSPPPPPAIVVDVAAGASFGCAVLSDATVMCWGANDLGQAGQPALGGASCLGVPCRVPTRVAGLTNVVRVAAGATSACAVTKTGDVYCWGDNSHSQLGHMKGVADDSCVNSTPCSRTPQPVTGVSNIADVTVSGVSACAVDTAGKLFCWGGNEVGELGRGTHDTDNELPAIVPAFADAGVVHVAADSTVTAHYCATKTDGSLWCWGRNATDELGFPGATPLDCSGNTQNCMAVPTTAKKSGATPFTGVTSFAAAAGATCVSLATSTQVWCWGYKGYAVADKPDGGADRSPMLVNTGVGGLAGTNSHACGIASGRVVKCWGTNIDGELGVPPSATDKSCLSGTAPCSFTPQPVPIVRAVKLALNRRLSFAVTPEGKLYGWGRNDVGSLGHPPTDAESNVGCGDACSPTPIEITPP
jgi:alpha-tubulin suppressor-like RCC1 family protein